MGFLKVSMLLLGAAFVCGHKLHFRGYKAPISFGKSDLDTSFFKSIPLNKYQIADGELWDLDSTNPWAPKVVEIEVSHEILHEAKPEVEFGGWTPIIPSWKPNTKTVGIWKASDYKPKSHYSDPKFMVNKNSWKHQRWNELQKPVVTKPLWSEHERKPYIKLQKSLWKSSDHQNDDDNHDDEHQDRGYKFNYGVESSETGDVKTHEERKNGDLVQGKYTVKEADGSTREVFYTAGKHTGFNAVVLNHGSIHSGHDPVSSTYSSDNQHHSEHKYHHALSHQRMSKDENPHHNFHVEHVYKP